MWKFFFHKWSELEIAILTDSMKEWIPVGSQKQESERILNNELQKRE